MNKHPKNEQAGKYNREEYISRINRVIDYVEDNYEKTLRLEDLAAVANFSSFHFHRIFKALIGETLNQFINRIRLEKAATKLIDNPKKSITEIAFDYGFSGSASFARAFREAFHMSASEWRAGGYRKNRKFGETNGKMHQTVSKMRKDFDLSSFYIDDQTQNLTWRMKMKNREKVKIEVKGMPDYHVAYVRHIGPYQANTDLFRDLFQKLMTWAGPRGLLRFPETKILSVYHDDPKVTEEDKLRLSACITVPEDTTVDGEVGKMVIPGGKFAVGSFEIAADEYGEAWDMVMGGWLPESGFQPDDRLCYEMNHNNPDEHPENLHIVDICVPVKPL